MAVRLSERRKKVQYWEYTSSETGEVMRYHVKGKGHVDRPLEIITENEVVPPPEPSPPAVLGVPFHLDAFEPRPDFGDGLNWGDPFDFSVLESHSSDFNSTEFDYGTLWESSCSW
jgi:hypothetical protein